MGEKKKNTKLGGWVGPGIDQRVIEICKTHGTKFSKAIENERGSRGRYKWSHTTMIMLRWGFPPGKHKAGCG